MTPPNLTRERIAEIRVQVQSLPLWSELQALCDLAAEALRLRDAYGTYGHQLGCSAFEDDGSECDCVVAALANTTKGTP